VILGISMQRTRVGLTHLWRLPNNGNNNNERTVSPIWPKIVAVQHGNNGSSSKTMTKGLKATMVDLDIDSDDEIGIRERRYVTFGRRKKEFCGVWCSSTGSTNERTSNDSKYTTED
ncbi:hypothetical protein M8C21_015919, partial [Ambrosia artemisiifolia]